MNKLATIISALCIYDSFQLDCIWYVSMHHIYMYTLLILCIGVGIKEL